MRHHVCFSGTGQKCYVWFCLFSFFFKKMSYIPLVYSPPPPLFLVKCGSFAMEMFHFILYHHKVFCLSTVIITHFVTQSIKLFYVVEATSQFLSCHQFSQHSTFFRGDNKMRRKPSLKTNRNPLKFCAKYLCHIWLCKNTENE